MILGGYYNRFLYGLWTAIFLVASLLTTSSGYADFPAKETMELPVTFPCYLTTGDLNNDGRTDIIVSSWKKMGENKFDSSSASVCAFYQQADGTFDEQADVEIPVNAWGVCAGDFDKDGKSDLFISADRRFFYLYPGKDDFKKRNTIFTVRHYFGNLMEARMSPSALTDFLTGPYWIRLITPTSGRMNYITPPSKHINSMTATVVDLNFDDIDDIVIAGRKNGIFLYYGPFIGNKVIPRLLSDFTLLNTEFPIGHIAVADMNGDKRPDLIAGMKENDSPKTVVYYQYAPLGFSPAKKAPDVVLDGVYGRLFPADVNADGKMDLIVADTNHKNVRIFKQNDDNTLTSSQSLSTRCYSSTVTDINNDASPDLIVGDIKTNTVKIYINTTKAAKTDEK